MSEKIPSEVAEKGGTEVILQAFPQFISKGCLEDFLNESLEELPKMHLEEVSEELLVQFLNGVVLKKSRKEPKKILEEFLRQTVKKFQKKYVF